MQRKQIMRGQIPAHFVATFCFTFVLLFEVDAYGNWYKSPSDVPHGDIMPQLENHSAYSLIECSGICANNQDCLTFHFNESEHECHTSCEGVPNTNGDVFGVAMSAEPVGDGYTLYMPWNITIKRHSTKQNVTEAEALCQSEGGHLLLIKDASVHCLVKSILSEMKSASVYVQGRDISGSGVFKSREETPLPYVKWKTDDPDGGSDKCIRLDMKENYDFGDISCRKPYRPLCEK